MVPRRPRRSLHLHPGIIDQHGNPPLQGSVREDVAGCVLVRRPEGRQGDTLGVFSDQRFDLPELAGKLIICGTFQLKPLCLDSSIVTQNTCIVTQNQV